MKTISYWINVLANGQIRLCSNLLFVLGLVMSIVILLQVFFRFFLQLPLPWSEEFARYLMIWMAMLGSVVALRMGRHLGVRVLVDRLPGRTYDVIVPFLQLVMIFFLGVIGVQGIDLAVANWDQKTAAMEIPMLIPYLAIPVGSWMMILDVVADMFQDFFPTSAGSNAKIAATTLEEIPPSTVAGNGGTPT
ncbi:MAG: TRAP transporter small permease [Thermodesulfobacteriota bacterium]